MIDAQTTVASATNLASLIAGDDADAIESETNSKAASPPTECPFSGKVRGLTNSEVIDNAFLVLLAGFVSLDPMTRAASPDFGKTGLFHNSPNHCFHSAATKPRLPHLLSLPNCSSVSLRYRRECERNFWRPLTAGKFSTSSAYSDVSTRRPSFRNLCACTRPYTCEFEFPLQHMERHQSSLSTVHYIFTFLLSASRRVQPRKKSSMALSRFRKA